MSDDDLIEQMAMEIQDVANEMMIARLLNADCIFLARAVLAEIRLTHDVVEKACAI